VQKTESAVRITHLPTGLVSSARTNAPAQEPRAGDEGLGLAAARPAVREQQAKEASQRKSLIGSGDRSERIRTYNFPQGRVTDTAST